MLAERIAELIETLNVRAVLTLKGKPTKHAKSVQFKRAGKIVRTKAEFKFDGRAHFDGIEFREGDYLLAAFDVGETMVGAGSTFRDDFEVYL